MRILIRLVVFLMIVSAAASAAAKPDANLERKNEQAKALPPLFQKRWVMLDCEKGKVSYRLSSYYVLFTTRQGSGIKRLTETIEERPGFYHIPALGPLYRFAIAPDGDLIQLFGEVSDNITLEGLSNGNTPLPKIRYKDCADNPPAALKENQNLLKIFSSFDLVYQTCPRASSIKENACQQAVFAVFDTNKDRLLDTQEISRLWDIAVPYSSINSSCGVPYSLPADAREIQPYLDWLLVELDTNRDRSFSLNELHKAWPLMMADPLMNVFTDILQSAQATLELLPPGLPSGDRSCAAPDLSDAD
ncbi:MAG: hypothetical protein HYS17_01310 [Micavibrio aeruginosavorus]|uniref:EF-hand domain-containing protein n=1 Tax=Micavibrio aeruginosavorus TaxID=349221 RepID=A0A7T5R2X9_9BACT|nr:MAG: hypothetical protein HYS17_01310 [Micavibrio aeruginosavorus]